MSDISSFRKTTTIILLSQMRTRLINGQIQLARPATALRIDVTSFVTQTLQ